MSLKIGIQSVNPLQGDEDLSKATIDFITSTSRTTFPICQVESLMNLLPLRSIV